MEELDKIAVGNRLREFALKKYGQIKPLADQLGMAQGGFTDTYLNGRSLPGAKIISKLMKLGCDIDWLLHGHTSPKPIKDKKEEYSPNKENSSLKKQIEELTKKIDQIKKIIN